MRKFWNGLSHPAPALIKVDQVRAMPTAQDKMLWRQSLRQLQTAQSPMQVRGRGHQGAYHQETLLRTEAAEQGA